MEYISILIIQPIVNYSLTTPRHTGRRVIPVFALSLIHPLRQFREDLAMHGKCQATFSTKYSSRTALDNDWCIECPHTAERYPGFMARFSRIKGIFCTTITRQWLQDTYIIRWWMVRNQKNRNYVFGFSFPFQSSTPVYDPINRKINLDSLSDFLISLFFLFQKLCSVKRWTPNIFLMNLLLLFSNSLLKEGILHVIHI